MAEHLDKAKARKILAGDQQVFSELFDDFFPRLYRFAKARLGNDDAARDVVQQTFCKAIERLDTYRGEAALYTWYCQICRNTIIDYCRSHRVESRIIVPLEDNAAIRAAIESLATGPGEQPENRAMRNDLVGLIQAALDALPARYGDALEWKYVEGYSVREIATRMNVSEKAVESTLTRARQAFRDVLTEIAATDELLPRSGRMQGNELP